MDEAITAFKLCTKQYPDFKNTYDSLGEAYSVNTDLEESRRNYKKAIAPGGTNANAMMRLEKN